MLLLEAFPGRTLEELDAMDFNRWWRAYAGVGRIRGLEERFRLYRAGKLKKENMTGDWVDLSEHERLLEEYGNIG